MLKIFLVYALVFFCSVVTAFPQRQFQTGQKEIVSAAYDFIRREAPALKCQLELLQKKPAQRLLDSFFQTVYSAYLVPGWVQEEIEIRRFTYDELDRLEYDPDWKNKVPQLSSLQRLAQTLYPKMKVPWGDKYLGYSWLSKLDINQSASAIQETFDKHGVILLRKLVPAEKPKLIVGCGDRVHTEPSDTYHPNPHSGDDTIDPVLRRNPTLVALFGEPPILPGNHYQTVFDEAPLVDIQEVHWREAERILKYGGLFILPSYTKGKKIPRGSKLRLHSIIGTSTSYHCSSGCKMENLKQKQWPPRSLYERQLGQIGYLAFAKPFPDGSFPVGITQEDMPFGVTLIDQRRVHLEDSLYVEGARSPAEVR